MSPLAFGEVPEPSLVASVSGHWERYRTSTICTVRWKFTMAMCPYFFLLDMACWRRASGIFPGQDHLAQCETELSGSKNDDMF